RRRGRRDGLRPAHVDAGGNLAGRRVGACERREDRGDPRLLRRASLRGDVRPGLSIVRHAMELERPVAPDVVSDLLRAVRVRSTVYCRSHMGAPWGFGVEAHGNPSFHVVTDGRCWPEVEGE